MTNGVNMELRSLSAEDMEQVRIWRLGCPESLRTPYMLTREMQADYYRDVICNRESTTRYWGLWVGGTKREQHGGEFFAGDYLPACTTEHPCDILIGYGGIENISWENGSGEISLLIGPDYRGKGYGKEAVGLFLDQAFNMWNLHTVHGECYECANWGFWARMCDRYGYAGEEWSVRLPDTKRYAGRWWDSYYFTLGAEEYRNHTGEDRQQADTA